MAPAPSPRPWRVEGLHVLDAAGRRVCSVSVYEAKTMDEMKADAAFIVALANQQDKEH